MTPLLRAVLAAFAGACAATSPVNAQAPASADEVAAHWRAITLADLDVAYRLVRDNHPAAAPELEDAAFRQNLESARATALQRAARVGNVSGYLAVMSGFGVGLEDKHLFFINAITPRLVRWPQFIVGRRGGGWVIVDGADDVEGARIVSCGGDPIEDYARERLGGFRAIWSIEAQRIANSRLLFIDDGNPFIEHADSCVIERDGQTREIALDWTRAPAESLRARLAAPVGHPGFGLERVDGGWWINLEGLSNRAAAVVAEARANRDALRRAPFVVLDMRGNGGGNSRYGDELAALLERGGAEEEAPATTTASSLRCPEAWRATPDNLAEMRDQLRRFAGDFGPEFARTMQSQIEGVEAALQRGDPFPYDVSACARRPTPPPATASASERFTVPVAIVTDHTCFSSCLLVTADFIARGAVHIGEATDAGTRYFETRFVELPSGLGFFSTMQKVSFGSQAQIGPFEPAHAFDGDIADTPAVRRRVVEIMTARR
jgi:hypothetical protein